MKPDFLLIKLKTKMEIYADNFKWKFGENKMKINLNYFIRKKENPEKDNLIKKFREDEKSSEFAQDIGDLIYGVLKPDSYSEELLKKIM